MNRLKNFFYFLLTFIFYKPFFLRSGRKIIIQRPILITPRYLKLGSHIFIRDFARLEGVSKYASISFRPLIEIHDHVSIEQNFHLTCASKVSIGEWTAIAANVTISDVIHPHEDITIAPELQPLLTKEVVIGKNCKIYNNAVILPGTRLGNHNIVAANSVVSGVYSDYCVIAGIPARVVKRYDLLSHSWLKNS